MLIVEKSLATKNLDTDRSIVMLSASEKRRI